MKTNEPLSALQELNVSKDQKAPQLELAARLVGYASGARYSARGNFLFEGMPLEGSHVLDIGCGIGAWTIWAALHGAERVIAIEPEAQGSTANSLATLRRTIDTLSFNTKIVATNQYLDQLAPQKRLFDVVVLFNVINHVDEEAVVTMHRDKAAFERYVSILKKLRERMNLDGWVLVADCARDNFWPKLGLRSPFARSIEWQKHQNPSMWIKVFKEAGFRFVDLRWSPLQPFPRLTANWLVQYFTCSHMVLRLRAM